jgi:transcriptional regulator with XRE-family HTH domain
MASRRVEIGPVGQRVAKNVAEVRDVRRMDQKDIATKTETFGRPLAASVVSKIEKLDRRVDVDDLVTLALALDVAPNRLLLPGDAGTDQPVELTPNVSAPTADAAWRWACGEYQPFPLDRPTPAADVLRFMATNRPHDARNGDLVDEIEQHREVLAPIAKAVRTAMADGVSLKTVVDYLRLTDALDEE